MACPSCGEKFYSDFKIRGTKSEPPRIVDHKEGLSLQRFLRWLYDNCFCFWFKS